MSAICMCGHTEPYHAANGTCSGGDPAINRNWCECTHFAPTDRETFIARQAQRWSGYWFYTAEQARIRAAQQWDRHEAL